MLCQQQRCDLQERQGQTKIEEAAEAAVIIQHYHALGSQEGAGMFIPRLSVSEMENAVLVAEPRMIVTVKAFIAVTTIIDVAQFLTKRIREEFEGNGQAWDVARPEFMVKLRKQYLNWAFVRYPLSQ